jgi:hypothetical protein
VYQSAKRQLKKILFHGPFGSVNLPTVARRTLAALVLAALAGCFHGFDVEDKEPPPGYPGGSCVAEDCYPPADCITDENVCYDTTDPCKGIYCGGHGTCGFDMDTQLPFCSCDLNYTNEPYAYYCIPVGG